MMIAMQMIEETIIATTSYMAYIVPIVNSAAVESSIHVSFEGYQTGLKRPHEHVQKSDVWIALMKKAKTVS